MNELLTCPSCNQSIFPTDRFCPHCGYNLSSSQGIGIGKQLYIYAVSLLLPPFGLIWTFKYFHSSEAIVRRVGIIAGVITIISCILTLWWFAGFWNSLQQQITTYQNLGM